MKKYLIGFKLPNGFTLTIEYYPDTPSKNYRIYLNGQDIGYRYEYLGNASKQLLNTISEHQKRGITNHQLIYGTVETVPSR